MAEASEARPPASAAADTARVFLSLAAGHALSLVSLSLLSSHLGLETFGHFGLCLIDFAVFANLGNFALPVASVPLVARLGAGPRSFSLVMSARLWSTLLAFTAYLAFETLVRKDAETVRAAWILALAILMNPQQLEWWSVARKTFGDLLRYRLVVGGVTLALVVYFVPRAPGLVTAAAAYAAGLAAGCLVLVPPAWRSLQAGSPRPSGLPAPPAGLRAPSTPEVLALYRASLPVAITGVLDFLFLPLGYYAFRYAHGDGELLGAYGMSHRLAIAASLAASSLFLVLLPRFSRPALEGSPAAAASDSALAARLDRHALFLAAGLIAVPFLARPVLRLCFPGTDWTAASLGFGAWALSCMAASTVLHLLRMAPLTKALAEGESWRFAGLFLLAGAVNLMAVGLGWAWAEAHWLPALSLSADAVFTTYWLYRLGKRREGAVMRPALVLLGLAAYLAWAHRFA